METDVKQKPLELLKHMWPATVGFLVFTDTQKFYQIDGYIDSVFQKYHYIKVIQIECHCI